MTAEETQTAPFLGKLKNAGRRRYDPSESLAKAPGRTLRVLQVEVDSRKPRER